MTNVTGALYRTLDPDICRTCKKRIFKECHSGLLPDGLRRLRLLLATDGSEFSHAPEEIAVDMARRFGVTLDVITSVGSHVDEVAARVRLNNAQRQAFVAGVDCETIVRQGGDPVKEIVAAARAADTSILIIGRRPVGQATQERRLGDLVHRVIVEAPCHVLVAGWQAHPWRKRILLATNGSAISDTAADIAAHIAKMSQLPVTVLRAVAPGADHAAADDDIAAKLGLFRVEGIECEGCIVEKLPEQAIVETAQQTGADLVIIGNDQRKGLARKIAGQTTDRVVGGLDCAVLVVKRPPEPADLVAAVRNQA